MSRWAETFAALSRGHDTIDTRSVSNPEGRACVASVKTVETIGQNSASRRNRAETLENLAEREPCVACVTSVNGREQTAPADGSAAFSPTHDTSATLATQGRALDAADLAERAAIIEEGAGVPRAWAEGFAALSTMPPPSGFSSERWRRIIDATGTFLEQWAGKAAECGWSDLDTFGCNPDRPDARFDAMGLVLLLDRCQVIAVDRDGATLRTESASEMRFYRRDLPADTVPLWQLIDAGLR